MTSTLWNVLRLAPALTLVGCVSDFSPDPYNKLSAPLVTDAGKGTKDAAPSTGPGSTTGNTDNDPDDGDPSAVDAGGPSDITADSSTPGTDMKPPAPSGPCDLSGRWVMSEMSTSSALGALQRALEWMYVEMTQEGDAITITKSLLCGGSVNEAPGQVFTINEDDSAAWPAYQKMTNYNGRTGTSKSSGSNCTVHFDQGVLVRGATVSTYKDVSKPMPTTDQPASASTPGWEDWDMDGNPGVSMVVTKSATNTLYSAFRTFGTYDGSIAQSAVDFKLTFDWTQERTVLGSAMPDPVGILSTPASRADDDSVNFAEFARLADNQATGSDDDICKAIRTLAPTLNPSANSNR